MVQRASHEVTRVSSPLAEHLDSLGEAPHDLILQAGGMCFMLLALLGDDVVKDKWLWWLPDLPHVLHTPQAVDVGEENLLKDALGKALGSCCRQDRLQCL